MGEKSSDKSGRPEYMSNLNMDLHADSGSSRAQALLKGRHVDKLENYLFHRGSCFNAS